MADDHTGSQSSRVSRRLRSALAGLAITLACIPIGLIVAALVSGDGGANSGGRPPRPTPAAATSASPSPSPSPQKFSPDMARAELAPTTSVVARIPARRTTVYTRPSTAAKHKTLRGATLGGRKLPLVLLVKRRRPGWLQVHLPTRPNLSSGWIKRSTARLAADPYRVKLELKRHRLSVWRDGKRTMSAAIGVGKSLTPTPTGTYYLTDLIEPPDPGGTYGPYAFGLSGHSPVLTSFAGGDGQLGLHGTNAPSALGTDVSHGCIRVRNAVITRLAKTLPLGTPVLIER